MRTIYFLLRKEFKQIFRDRTLLAIIFVMPLMQLIILPLAANYEIYNINLCVVDNDHSTYSQQLIQKVTASGYFRLVDAVGSYDAALKYIERDEADVVLQIPAGFERDLIREGEQKIFIAVNAINGVKANLGGSYLNALIRLYNGDMRLQWIRNERFAPLPMFNINTRYWYNPYMNYNLFMVPGILSLLVTMVGSYLTALNIVREKEIGTIEQINVTPIKKYQFVLGKLIPFWVLGMVVFTIGLLVARIVYNIIPVGNVGILYMFLAVYLLAVLGLGLLLSTYANTQQQAMFITFFFVMIFTMMGGLFTAIDSMPAWAQLVTRFNPISYFIDVMRMVVLKGSSLADIQYHFAAVGAIALVLNSWAILNYRKTS